MTARLEQWRADVQPLLDPAIALACFGLSLLPLLDQRGCGCPAIPVWAYVLVAATCAPLTVRRRFPFAVGLSTGTLTVLYGVSTLPDPPVPYAALVGLYTVAAWAARRTARLAAGIAVFGVVVAFVIDRSNSDVQDVSVIVLVLATAWLLGDGARNRRERALDLEARAAELERTRERDARAAVAAERQRIAREMHDVIAHHVSMMVVQAEAGPLVVADQPQRAIEAFDAIGSAGKRALGEMRRLLGVLREDGAEAPLAPQPGADRIPELVAGVRSAGLDVVLDVEGRVRRLPPAVDLSAYRLVQEALTNCLRHAGPARVAVLTRYDTDRLTLRIDDDGPVPDVDATARRRNGGHGLVAMRERVALVGGRFEVGPGPDGGWRVQAELPVPPSAAEDPG